MKVRRYVAALGLAVGMILVGPTVAWATEGGCVGSAEYCATPSPTPSPSETPPVEVTVPVPTSTTTCEDGTVLDLVDGPGYEWTYLPDDADIWVGAGQTVTVTAVANDGFILVGDTTWTFTGEHAEDCAEPTPTPDPTPPSPPELPATGTGSALLAIAGFAAIVAGGLLYALGRRP